MSHASENMECTENDSTDTVNIAAEKPPSDPVADVVVADLSFSPPCTSTQLNAVTTAKHGRKTKGRGKDERSREKHTGYFWVQECKHKGK